MFLVSRGIFTQDNSCVVISFLIIIQEEYENKKRITIYISILVIMCYMKMMRIWQNIIG